MGPIFRALGLFDASTDEHFSHLIRSFQIERPRQRLAMPRWNLGLVLNSFLKAPYVGSISGHCHFGSYYGIDLKWLTVKAVFLVTLATGRRVSCIRSLANDFTVSRGRDRGQQVLILNTLSSELRISGPEIVRFLRVTRYGALSPRYS